MRHRCLKSIALAMTVLASGILACSPPLTPEDREFLLLTPAERHDALVRREPEEQVRLFLLAMDKTHPPDLTLVESLAAGGAAVAPLIVTQLEAADNDDDRLYLLMVLGTMASQGHYDLRDDSRAISVAKAVVEVISVSSMRRLAEDELRIIAAGGPDRTP